MIVTIFLFNDSNSFTGLYFIDYKIKRHIKNSSHKGDIFGVSRIA